jgi:solute carrier family 25 protein 39/40
MTAAAARVDLSSAGGGGGIPGSGASSSSSSQPGYSGPHQQAGVAGAAADQELGMAERALSAAGAAFVSAIIVNPLDVAKTRLQAQAAGVPYYQPSQMASLGPDAVTNLMISMRVPCGWFAI